MPTVTTLSGTTVSVDLGTRDFEGFTFDALELAETIAPEWTDRSEVDQGVTLVELMAFMSDNNSYYQDRCANEGLFPSAVQRRSVIQHCKLIGYELSPSVSASVELTFVTSGAGVVPAGTKVDTDTSDGSELVTFELESDFVSGGAGTTTGEIALHGTTVSETVGSSTGLAGQSFPLGSSPLSQNPDGTWSLEVYVAEGGPPALWTRIDNFLQSESTDKHYRAEIDEFDTVTIFFGDGVNGKIPASGTNNITSTYRVGGGKSGNSVGRDRLTKLQAGYSSFVTSVTNPDQPSGGDDKESIEAAKVNAPASLASLDRAVTHTDYKTLALEVPGAGKALAYQGNGAYEEIIVIAAEGTNPIPTGSWDSFLETGSGLLGEVGDYLTVKKTTPVILIIKPALVYDMYLDFTAYLYGNTRREDATRLIQDAIIGDDDNPGILDVRSVNFGVQISLSLIHDTADDVPGVDYIDLNIFQRQPYARLITEASVTDVSFTITVGETTLRDTWTLRFISPTQYTVEGVSNGTQATTGTIGVLFTTDDGGMTILATAGAIAPSSGDTFEIVSGPYVGNMDPDSDELGKAFDGTFVLSLVGGLG